MNDMSNSVLEDTYYSLSHNPIHANKISILLSPVLIVGSPRSGTTWLQRILLEIPDICGGQESHFYTVFNSAFLSVNDKKDRRRVGLSGYWEKESFNKQMKEVWIRTFLPILENKPHATVLLEKTPFHAFYLDEIRAFIPETKFIHLIRDSRAVTASLNAASKGWGRYWAPKGTKRSALEWYRHVKAVRSSNVAKNKLNYLEVHYEDLLTDPVSELNKILKFIGLEQDENMILSAIENQEFSKQKQQDGSGLTNFEGKKIKEPAGFFRKGVADAWKTDLNVIQKLFVWRFTRKLMKECGYDWKGRAKKV